MKPLNILFVWVLCVCVFCVDEGRRKVKKEGKMALLSFFLFLFLFLFFFLFARRKKKKKGGKTGGEVV